MALSTYRKCVGIILVYDVTEVASYTNLSQWLDMIAEHAQPDCIKMLLGNKIDKINEIEVS